MFKKSISLVLSIIMLVAICAFAPVSYAEGYINYAQDFSGFTPTAYGPEEFGNMVGLEVSKSGSTGLWVTEDGKVKLHCVGGSSTSAFFYNIQTPVEKNALSVSYRFNNAEVTGGDTKLTMFRFYSGSNEYDTLAMMCQTITGVTSEPEKDSEGFYNLRAVVQRQAETDDWEVKIYDDVAKPAAVVYESTLPKEQFPNIDKILICATYSNTVDCMHYVDDIKVKTGDYEAPIVPPVVINYTQDFSGITPTAYGPEEFGNMVGLEVSKSGSTGLWVTEDGKVKFHCVGNSSTSAFFYNIQTPVEKDALSVSYRFNNSEVTGGDTKLTMFRFYSGSNEYDTLAMMCQTITGVTSEPEKDSEGFYNLRAVVQRQAETDDWEVKIYDDVAKPAAVVYESTLPKEQFPNIDKILICATYSNTVDCMHYVDDIKVKTGDYMEPVVVIDYKQDFNSMTRDFHSGITFTNESGLTTAKSDGTGLKVDEMGRVYFYHLGEGNTASFFYEIPKDGKVRKGGLSVGMKISNTARKGSARFDILGFYCEDNAQYPLAMWGHGLAGATTTPKEDANGMFNLRADIYRATENTDWVIAIYDELAEIPTTVYYSTLSKEEFPYIDRVLIGKSYGMSSSDEFIFDDVYVKTFDSYEGTISQNFDDLEDSINTNDALEAATGVKVIKTGAAVEIIKEGNNKKLKLSHTADGQTSLIKYAIPVIATGTVEFSAKLSQDGTEGDPGIWYTASFFDGEFEVGPLVERHGVANFKNTKQNPIGLRKDADTGMYHLRVVVSRNNVESDWTYTVWCDGGSAQEASLKVDEGKISKEDLEKIDAIGIISSYGMGNTNIIVDDVEIKYYKGITLDRAYFACDGTIVDKVTAGMTNLIAYIKLHSSDVEIEDLTIVMGIYSSEGRLLGVTACPIDEIGSEMNETDITLSVQSFTTDSGSYAKLFFFENDLSKVIPIRANGGLFPDGFCD